MGMDLLSLAPASLLSQISERNPSRNLQGSSGKRKEGSARDLESHSPKSRSQVSHSLAVRL